MGRWDKEDIKETCSHPEEEIIITWNRLFDDNDNIRVEPLVGCNRCNRWIEHEPHVDTILRFVYDRYMQSS